VECVKFSEVVGATSVTEIVPRVTVETVTEVAKEINTNSVLAHYSHYTPWTGGTNCAVFVNGECISKTSSGERWEDWVEKGVACVGDWEFGTEIIAFGQTWTCIDRGGYITYDDWRYFDGLPWIDFLTANAHLPYGTIISVEVVQ
jgi:hypothetical protein